MYQCLLPDACAANNTHVALQLASSPNPPSPALACTPGYRGTLCGDCEAGYSKAVGGNCEACWSAAASWAVTVLVFLGTTLLYLYVIRRSANKRQRRSRDRIILRVLINYLQVRGW